MDDTGSPRFLRDGWQSVAGESAAQFALVYVDSPEWLIRKRVTKNRGSASRHDVTDEVMQDHLARVEPPATDEPAVIVHAESLDTAEPVARVRLAPGNPEAEVSSD